MTTDTHLDIQSLGLTGDQLLQIYRLMLLTREVDERIRTLYFQGTVVGGVYSQLGHEAISVGTASALRPDDVVAPMHRDLGAHLVRGLEVRRILAQLMGRAAGYSAGKDNALHFGDLQHGVLSHISMLGTTIPLCAGVALAAKQRGDDRVALTYVGDGAINTGDFHEGLNFAAALHLPFILIVENNQFAYSTPVSRQIAFTEIAQRATGYGIPGVRIDGNDVLAVYEATRAAGERARRGDGPTLIECVTMRMRGHSEQDNASYVPAELLAEWKTRDPVERYARLLGENGMMSREADDALQAEVRREVADAAGWAERQPFPEPETVGYDVNRDPPRAKEVGGSG